MSESIVLVIVLVTGAVTLVATGYVLYALVRGSAADWRGYPPSARRRGKVVGVAAALLLAAGMAAVIVSPAGERTVIYVMVGYFALVLLIQAVYFVVYMIATRARR